jgi:hypothetical protein
MMVARELGKSVEEVTQLSVLELQLWSAFFKLERDESKRAMDHGRSGKNRTSSR